MKRLVLPVLLVVAALSAMPAWADGLKVRSLQLQGRSVDSLPDVLVRLPGQPQARPQALATGQDLASGTELTVPRGASAVLVSRHDNAVTLSPGASFIVGVVAPSGESHEVAAGKAEFSVRRALDFFNIGHGARFTAAVKGTVFAVEVLAEQQSIEFQVSEGAVEVEQRLRLPTRDGEGDKATDQGGDEKDDSRDDEDAAGRELRIVEDIAAGQSRRYPLSVGQYLREFGNLAEVDGYFQRALAEAERSGDALRVQRATANLMRALALLRRHQAVVDLGPRCIDSARKAGQPQAERSCWTLLGNAHQDLRQFAQAQQYHQRVLDAERERTQGRDSPQQAVALNNLALALRAQGQAAQAQRLLGDSLAMVERLNGPVDSEAVMVRLANLGSLQRQLGDVAQAAVLHQRALDMGRRVFPGGRHPRVAAQLAALARDQALLGNLPLATTLQQEALALNQALFPGRDLPDIAANAFGLAGLLLRQGRPADARGPAEAALAMRQRLAGGQDAAPVASSLFQLGAILDALNEVEPAFARHEAALAMRERLAGGQPDVPVRQSLRALADLSTRHGRPADARRYAQRAAAVQRALRGDP